MPELPEVETVRRGLAPSFEGHIIARVETRRGNLRLPFPERFAERLAGRRVLKLTRRAKYLLAEIDSGETLAMHLGMSGSFRIEARHQGAEAGERELVEGGSRSSDAPRPATSSGRGQLSALAEEGAFYYARNKAAAHDHVIFDFEGGARVIYNDPRRFGLMTLIRTSELTTHPLFAELGVEPLSATFDAARLGEILAGVRAPLKSALLDQRRVAGLGNIYVCEALHRARLSPSREAGSLSPSKLKALNQAIRAVLFEAIEAGGSTLRDYRQADGELGYFQHAFAVYDREGAACPRRGCQGTILRIAQGGRSTFYCAVCQK